MDDRIQRVELKTIEREIENYKRKISRCEEDLQHYKEELKKTVRHKNFLEYKSNLDPRHASLIETMYNNEKKKKKEQHNERR